MVDISIFTPVYNAEQYIKECIESVLSQEFKGTWEWIIVDDGSTDRTIEIIKEYNDERIKLFENEHLGLVLASNFALENCTGKYCARIDADDIMMPNRLQKQFDFMESHPEFAITCGLARIQRGPLKFTTGIRNKEIKMPLLMFAYPIAHSSVMMLKEKDFRYNKDYEWAEDVELWARALSNGERIFSIDDVFATCRIHGENIMITKHEANKELRQQVKREYFFNKK